MDGAPSFATMRVGVLALQGSCEPHCDRLVDLGVEPVRVRRLEHLEGLTHLVFPGGESTTLWRLLELYGLWEPIIERSRAGELVLFGTCAGAILMGGASADPPPRMELLDAVVHRNAYGRQLDSFTAEVELTLETGHIENLYVHGEA